MSLARQLKSAQAAAIGLRISSQESFRCGGHILAIAFLAAALTPAIVLAGPRASGAPQVSVPDKKSNAGAKWTVNITTQEPNGSSTSGPCTGGAGLADFCPVGPCDCYTSSGSASGSVGHGSATVYETIDFGQEFGVEGDCTTAYLDIEITGATKDNESIGADAGDCYNENVTSTEYVSGGCELGTSSTLFSDAEGQCSGSYGALKHAGFP
ncbi:MAG TPA: hypothetical protein VJX68_13965 [Candidatus Binatus sp.]|nr:hypothetical protein [Candidatus Binatus sp.]